jgi:Flp pilus assembly protein TadD
MFRGHFEGRALLDEPRCRLEDFLKRFALHARDRPRVPSIRQEALLGISLCGALFACARGETRVGLRALDAHDYPRAVEHLQSSADAHPGDAHVWVALGRSHLALGNAKAALDAFQRARALVPRSPRIAVLVGFACELGRDYERAERVYTEATALAPEDPFAHRILGVRLLRWGRAADAVAPLAVAVARARQDVEARHALAIAFAKSGQLPAAEASYRRAIADAPTQRSLWLGLGIVLVDQGKLVEALEHYRGMERRFPDFTAVRRAQAELYLELGQKQEAISALERAIEVTPDDASLHARRAAILESGAR